MNLWFSALLLAMGFSMSNSALTPEQCKPLITPKPVFKPMYGRWTFIMGYSDNPVYDSMFRSTQSQWVDFLLSPSGRDNEMIEDIGIRHPTYCKYASTPILILGNSAIGRKSNFTCNFHSLPTCPSCLLYHVTAINNNLLTAVANPTTTQQLKSYSTFYLMSTKTKISAAELAHAKQQAECLGFKGEPTFLYDTANSFCHQGIDP